MSREDYLYWLRQADLERVSFDDLRIALAEIGALLVEEMTKTPETGPREMLAYLTHLNQKVESGALPLEEIEQFRNRFLPELEFPVPPEAILESELREIATGIDEKRWATDSYQSLQKAITQFLEGGEENEFWAVIDSLEERLEEVEGSYLKTTIVPREVTTESTVCHNLLREGFQLWGEALSLIGESEDEPDWDHVLELAEQGNRLLVSVQIFNERLQNAVRRPSG